MKYLPLFLKIIGIAFIILCALIFRPVPTATEYNTWEMQTEVLNIREGGINDVVFKFKDHPGAPYINRGLERGLEMEALKSKLIGSKVNLKFVHHWTPLDPKKMHPTVAYIAMEETGEIIFDALKY